MISKNQAYFVISQIRICDITKCVIFYIYEMISPVRKKKCAEYRVISARNHLRPGHHHILNLYDNILFFIVLVQNKEGIQIFSNKQCHLFIFNCYTLSSFMSRTTRGRGRSENIIKLSHPCNGDSQHQAL